MRNFLLIFNFVLLALLACKDSEKSMYENCCGVRAVTDELPVIVRLWNDDGVLVDSMVTARIFIPNMVAPEENGTGNELFLVCGKYVKEIVSMKCTSESGEVICEESAFLPCDISFSFDGRKPDGSLYFGRFDYRIEVRFINDSTKVYNGSACSYQCNASGFPVENLPNCIFFGQNDGAGGYDPSFPVPANCF